MKNCLLPHGWKDAGSGLTILGVVSFILYTWFDFRFKIPVFAVYSKYLKTKVFETFKTPFAVVMTMLLIITGLALIVFSREKDESEITDSILLKSLIKAILINTIIMAFGLLFIYGTAYFVIPEVNLFSLFVIYLIVFYLEKGKTQNQ